MTANNNLHKAVALVLILSMFSCSAPVRKNQRAVEHILTAENARKSEFRDRVVHLKGPGRTRAKGHLIGWTDSGFIIYRKNRLDTLEYASLHNWVLFETDQLATAKGEKQGFWAGIGVSVLNAVLILNSDHQSNDESKKIQYLFISIPAIITAFTGLGAIAGSLHKNKEKYYYDKNDFQKSPWLALEEFELINFKRER
jgi:hypothetical protein